MSIIDYGADTSCTDELHAGRVVAGVELVAEAIYRRLITPRGRLIDDPSYGLDVRALLGQALTDRGLSAIPGIIRGEVKKDPRVDICTVRATRTTEGLASVSLRLEINFTTALGPFALVLLVSDLTVERLRP